jgi:thioredoxin reductase
MERRRVAILGAGPVGIEAAHRAVRLGFDTLVLEAGNVAQHLRSFGHVRLFTPWSMLTSPLGLEILGGDFRAADDRCPTAAEYASAYVLPLAEGLRDRAAIVCGERVVAISRASTRKAALLGQPARASQPFRILTESAGGAERVHEADVVLDCTGTYSCPNALGDGGIAAPGERRFADRISYTLDDVRGADRARYAGQRILLVGAGYSAMTEAVALAALQRESPATRVTWVIDAAEIPPPIENDPLASRAALHRAARQVVARSNPTLTFVSNATVERIAAADDALRVRLRVRAAGERATREVDVDRVLACVGFGPDNSIYRELQVHECYASRGPMKLAAALLGASGAGGDCLSAGTGLGPDLLASPEPAFFILGSKSYGRRNDFLLQRGFEQVRDVFVLLSGAREPS